MSSTAERVDRLLGFLEADPDNLRLIAESAEAAMDVSRFEVADQLVARYEALGALPASLSNLAGLASLSLGRPAAARARFEAALTFAPDDPALRFNLACARAGEKDWAGASELLDETVAATNPAAAALKVQMLHQLGQVEDALAWGAGFADRLIGQPELLAALSAAALDADEVELAGAYARRAGDAPEALATLGMLELDDLRLAESGRLFDRALAIAPGSGRALLGKGLAALAQGDGAEAPALLDRAAEIFADHPGSWIAAGWAHVVVGDLAEARVRFETALRIDGSSADAHAALAVMDMLAGRADEAKRQVQTALRLDRDCFSAILARSALRDQAGDTEGGERLRQTVLDTPVTSTGQTIAEVLARFASRRR